MSDRDEQRQAPPPDDVMHAALAYEATLPDGGGTGYALPPNLAEHVMPGLPSWCSAEEFEGWRRDNAETWEAEGRRAAVREYFSPPCCPAPPA